MKNPTKRKASTRKTMRDRNWRPLQILKTRRLKKKGIKEVKSSSSSNEELEENSEVFEPSPTQSVLSWGSVTGATSHHIRSVSTVVSGQTTLFTEMTMDKQEQRQRFVSKVFTILSVIHLVTVGFVAGAVFAHTVSHYLRNHAVFYILAYIFFGVIYLPLVCFEVLRLRRPLNVVMLIFFTLSLGNLLGIVTAYHELEWMLFITLGALLVTIVVALLTRYTMWDVSGYGLYLCVLIITIMMALVAMILFCAFHDCIAHGRLYHLFLAVGAVLMFGMYLLYDTRNIMAGNRVKLSRNEYVACALYLWTDITHHYVWFLDASILPPRNLGNK